MPKLTPLFNADTGGNAFTGPAVDLVTSHASGQLLLSTTQPWGNYYGDLTLTQAPTISGPWTRVPAGGHIDYPTGTDAGTALVPYTRSCRFLQITGTNNGASPLGLAAGVVEPPPPLSLT